MLVGKVLVVLNLLWMAANIWISWINARQNAANNKHSIQLNEMRVEAMNQALEIQSQEFKVCKTCGKIVQGLCMSCAMQRVAD